MLKRIISGIAAVLVCISLSGCGDSPPQVQTETATEQTTVTTPTDLTEEEMEIWENMPEVVTMRVLNHYEAKTTEIMYIEKTGVMKSFVCDEYYNLINNPEWITDKINKYEADITDVVDLHKLIEFYSIFLLVDLQKEMYNESTVLMFLPMEHDYNYCYEAYVKKQNGNVVRFAEGQVTYNSYISDSNGKNCFLRYLNFDSSIPYLNKTEE